VCVHGEERLHGEPVIARMVSSGVAWGFGVSGLAVLVVLAGLGGAEYYRTPLRIRGYAPGHRVLRPSGPVGQTLGVAGTALMVVPFVYMGRKRLRRLKPVGAVKSWLEIHLFCGIVGPVLVTLHTSFKFNGIISAAYWSMVLVMLSGFIGRYLYVRIPRSVRGNELSRAELEAEADHLKATLSTAGANDAALRSIEAFETSAIPSSVGHLSLGDLMFGEFAVRRKLQALAQELAGEGLRPEVCGEVIRLTAERATLIRRAAYLQRTRKLFDLWHVFHLPLVYLMLVIAAAHISLALYMGYVPFRW
jgi:hypothetical protein